MNDQLIYIGYARKSSQEDSKQAQSIGTQKRILKDHMVKDNLNLIDVMVEQKSAKEDGQRPVFSHLLKRFESDEANALLVAHIDRISRNEFETGQIFRLFGRGNIKEIRTPTKIYDSIDDLFFLNMELAMASKFSRDLSIKVKEGNLSKLKSGGYPRQAPIGYFNNDGNIYVDPVTSPLIQQMFDFYASGDYSLKQLTKIMYDRGLRTKTGKNKVHKSRIHKALTNTFYYGVMYYHEKYYQGNHKPLVSKELFDRVQIVLRGKGKPKSHKLHFLYRGYMTCSECGCSLTATKKKGRYVYYYCTNGKGGCSQRGEYLKESQVKQKISKVVSRITLPEDVATETLHEYSIQLRDQDNSFDAVRINLTKELEGIGSKLDRLEDMLLEERITKEKYDTKRKNILKSQVEIKTQLANLPHKNVETTLELLNKFKNQAISLEKVFENGDDQVKEDLLKGLLWNCKIKDKEVISTRYKIPFTYLEGMSKETDFIVWYAQQDSNLRPTA